MTPKEKAIELYNKMYDYSLFEEEAKRCALIAVDEILNSNPNYPEVRSIIGYKFGCSILLYFHFHYIYLQLIHLYKHPLSALFLL